MPHIQGRLQICYGHGSIAGAKEQNDDALGIKVPGGVELGTKGITTVIADGVSTAEAGGEGAQVCVLGFINDYYSTPETWGVKTAGQRVLSSINRWLYSEGRKFIDESKGYIAAMSAVVFKSRSAHIFHAGDTRVYRMRAGRFEQITNDHTSQVSRKQSYLNRAMGLNLNLRIDYHVVGLQVGDIFFLSTDGIHDFVRGDAIAETLLRKQENLDGAAEELIDMALGCKSLDNLSCQIVKIEEVGSEDGGDVYRELNRLPFPPDLDPGMRFEGYRIERLMHASSRSQLYLATDPDSGENVVIKTPSVSFEDDAGYIDRFVLEEWVGRRISNRHLIKMRMRKSLEPRFLYHVMEHVEGRSLRDWISCNPQPSVKEVVEIIDGVIRGLRAMHRKETLHGDLKPDNIMIDTDGTPKIIDYGSAYVLGMREIDMPFHRSIALGTERYSAPEYKLGRKPTPRSDQFSLAMIAYEMLTHGHRPFGEKFEKANSQRDFSVLKYEPAAAYNPHVTTWVDGALKCALNWNPDMRQPSMSEFLADLKRPNPDFLTPADAPLLERNPVAFWKGVSFCLFFIILVLIGILVGTNQ